MGLPLLQVEIPEHALLACDASIEVKALREVFLDKLFTYAPSLHRRWLNSIQLISLKL
jgi:hypothetical protein